MNVYEEFEEFYKGLSRGDKVEVIVGRGEHFLTGTVKLLQKPRKITPTTTVLVKVLKVGDRGKKAPKEGDHIYVTPIDLYELVEL